VCSSVVPRALAVGFFGAGGGVVGGVFWWGWCVVRGRTVEAGGGTRVVACVAKRDLV